MLGLLPLVACSSLRSSARLIFFVSVADTLHVYLLSHMFWDFLVRGRFIGFSVLLELPWFVPCLPILPNNNDQVALRRLMVSPLSFYHTPTDVWDTGIIYRWSGPTFYLHKPLKFLTHSVLVDCYHCSTMVSPPRMSHIYSLNPSWTSFFAFRVWKGRFMCRRTIEHLTNFLLITVSRKNWIAVSIIVNPYSHLNIQWLTVFAFQVISSLVQLGRE